MTSQDLIRIGVILVLVGIMAWGAVDLSVRPPKRFYWDLHVWPLGIYIGLVGSQWYTLYANVIWRRRDRSSFWNEHGAGSAEDDQDFAEAAGSMALLSFGVIAIVGPPFVHTLLLFDAFAVPKTQNFWLALGATALAAIVFYSGTHAEKSRPVGTARAMRMMFEAGERGRAAKKAERISGPAEPADGSRM